MRLYPSSKDIENICDRLMRYPVVKVNGKKAQAFSRNSKIRYLSYREGIYIQGGVISIPEKTKIKKSGKCFNFDF
jgi:hypothetical protein